METEHIIVLAFLVLVAILCLADGSNDKLNKGTKEHVAPVSWKGSGYGNYWSYYDYPLPSDQWLARNHALPWWNSTRHTRNMSWDIRGDVKPKLVDTGPFYRSPHIGYHDVDYM